MSWGADARIMLVVMVKNVGVVIAVDLTSWMPPLPLTPSLVGVGRVTVTTPPTATATATIGQPPREAERGRGQEQGHPSQPQVMDGTGVMTMAAVTVTLVNTSAVVAMLGVTMVVDVGCPMAVAVTLAMTLAVRSTTREGDAVPT